MDTTPAPFMVTLLVHSKLEGAGRQASLSGLLLAGHQLMMF